MPCSRRRARAQRRRRRATPARYAKGRRSVQEAVVAEAGAPNPASDAALDAAPGATLHVAREESEVAAAGSVKAIIHDSGSSKRRRIGA
jgi:hypothetical protein